MLLYALLFLLLLFFSSEVTRWKYDRVQCPNSLVICAGFSRKSHQNQHWILHWEFKYTFFYLFDKCTEFSLILNFSRNPHIIIKNHIHHPLFTSSKSSPENPHFISWHFKIKVSNYRDIWIWCWKLCLNA